MTITTTGVNKLKLGLFGLNIEHGGTMSTVPGLLDLEWPRVERLARGADAMGLELLVPVARWRGFGGTTDYAGKCFDTFCWAAGLAAATNQIGLMSTVHVPTIHPLLAAKQLATIDHISGGRSALNIVGGWFRPELEMFGAPMLEHDRRYELAEEWTKILKHLWTEDEPLTFAGEFFSVKAAVSNPKPLQRPRPPIMNAGNSPRGRRFAAEWADMVFVSLEDDQDPDVVTETVDRYKGFARSEFGRDIELWTAVTVTCDRDEAEARRLEREIIERADNVAVDNFTACAGMEAQAFGHAWQGFRERIITGWGGPQLTGTPDQVAERLYGISTAGIDGCLLTLPYWEEGLATLGSDVLPRLETMGLRVPANRSVAN
jgi:alkanesulfonate monooxygenase SsuD/methylene tetrahydromethanopterin reductase-like flavin-dependent oxidoreductase (luciferase family)